MRCHPVGDLRKPVGNRSCVKNVALRMAEVRFGTTGRPLNLGLQEANAVVELCGDIVLLVGGEVVGRDEWRVMASNLGDIAVLAHAKLGVVVTGLRVGDGRRLDTR